MGKTSSEVKKMMERPRVTSVAKQRSNDEALESTRVAKHTKRSPEDTLNGATAVPGSNVVVQRMRP